MSVRGRSPTFDRGAAVQDGWRLPASIYLFASPGRWREHLEPELEQKVLELYPDEVITAIIDSIGRPVSAQRREEFKDLVRWFAVTYLRRKAWGGHRGDAAAARNEVARLAKLLQQVRGCLETLSEDSRMLLSRHRGRPPPVFETYVLLEDLEVITRQVESVAKVAADERLPTGRPANTPLEIRIEKLADYYRYITDRLPGKSRRTDSGGKPPFHRFCEAVLLPLEPDIARRLSTPIRKVLSRQP